mmetsp:Transcript_18945/g.38907  ORF Transcript_18945/g.38907 Transcript_18945/m.38907 type:complete len:272 (-) Transcript_18945:1571-2386(-)
MVLFFVLLQVEDELLKVSHPGLGKHAVLEQHPIAVPAPVLDEVFGNLSLALAQGNEGQGVRVPLLLGKPQQRAGWIRTLAQDEDTRHRVGEVPGDVSHGGLGGETKLLSYLVGDKLLDGALQLVLLQALEENQPLEGIQGLLQLLVWELLLVRVFRDGPRRPSLPVVEQALDQPRKGQRLVLLPFVHRNPRLDGVEQVPLLLRDVVRVGILLLLRPVHDPGAAHEETPLVDFDVFPVLQDGETDERAEQELVPLEETPADVRVDGIRGVRD